MYTYVACVHVSDPICLDTSGVMDQGLAFPKGGKSMVRPVAAESTTISLTVAMVTWTTPARPSRKRWRVSMIGWRAKRRPEESRATGYVSPRTLANVRPITLT